MTAPAILLVEDDSALRMVTARALRESGYAVRTAATGAEMLVMLEAEPAELVVLDIMQPGTNGIELFRKVRRQSDVPIIFASARASDEDRVLGLELGADDYIAKPYNPRELIARIGAVLRRSGAGTTAGERADEVEFNGWRLSLLRRELHAPGGEMVNLTGAEFDLLAAFINQRQRVLGRERLIELSRTREGDSSDRSIDVLVSRLRRKLSVSGSIPPIVTVRGVGYMFRADVRRL
jgi:two-component system, OmpR family, response regulator